MVGVCCHSGFLKDYSVSEINKGKHCHEQQYMLINKIYETCQMDGCKKIQYAGDMLGKILCFSQLSHFVYSFHPYLIFMIYIILQYF